jgi:hypothetical protein
MLQIKTTKFTKFCTLTWTYDTHNFNKHIALNSTQKNPIKKYKSFRYNLNKKNFITRSRKVAGKLQNTDLDK